jgi:putative transcriptional regulator
MTMSEEMSDFAKELLVGLAEAAAYVNDKPNAVRTKTYVFADAKSIREALGMSQNEFSRTYGIPLDTLQNWEQRRTNPDRTASAYLWAIAELPKQIGDAQTARRASMPDAGAMTL